MKVKFMKSIAFSGGKFFKIGQEVDEEEFDNLEELRSNGICDFLNIQLENNNNESEVIEKGETIDDIKGEEDSNGPEVKIEDMDVKQLKDLCGQMGLKGYKNLKKEELLSLIDAEIKAKTGESNEN